MKSNSDEIPKRAILLKGFIFEGAHEINTHLHFGHTGTVFIADGIHRFHPDGVAFAVRIQPSALYNNPETCTEFYGDDVTLPPIQVSSVYCELAWGQRIRLGFA